MKDKSEITSIMKHLKDLDVEILDEGSVPTNLVVDVKKIDDETY